MAGKPIYREAVARILEFGGEEWIMDQFMNGEHLSKIAAVMDISRGMLYEWLHKDKQRWELYCESRKIGAHALVEQAIDILEHSTVDSITVDRERAKIRQWIAERVNRRDFGGAQSQQSAINVSIGELHLGALQAAPAALPAAPETVVEPEDVEVIENE